MKNIIQPIAKILYFYYLYTSIKGINPESDGNSEYKCSISINKYILYILIGYFCVNISVSEDIPSITPSICFTISSSDGSINIIYINFTLHFQE